MSQRTWRSCDGALDAFNRGDLQAVSDLQDPDIEWQTSVEDPDAATHKGRAAVRRFFEGWTEAFSGLRADPEECIEAPGGRVLAAVQYTGRASASGIDMDWRQSHVYTVRAGLIVRAEEYSDSHAAREAAGLSE